MVVSQTYLVAQITVEQISLNLADEINGLIFPTREKFSIYKSYWRQTERADKVKRRICFRNSKLDKLDIDRHWQRKVNKLLD